MMFNKKFGGKIDPLILISILAIAFLAIIVFLTSSNYFRKPPAKQTPPVQTPVFTPAFEEIKKFTSKEEFVSYLKETQESGYSWEKMGMVSRLLAPTEMPPREAEMGIGAEKGGGGEIPKRISETTVQVEGIDEPDIVKTDGKEIYFSRPPYYGRIYEERGILPPHPSRPYRVSGETLFIKALPPTELRLDEFIPEAGNLLLVKNKLVILPAPQGYSSNPRLISGYNVDNPRYLSLAWRVELSQNTSLVAARLYQNKIYLIIKSYIQQSLPCPIKPLEIDGAPLTVECHDIYHPVRPVSIDATFMVIILNPETGKIEKTTSFVGSSGSSVVYMSPNAVYITYTYSESFFKFFLEFLKEKGQGLYPEELIAKLKRIGDYDISEAAKLVELQTLVENYVSSLNDDEKLRFQNELNNRMADYYNRHLRELEKTGIVKIDSDSLSVVAAGNVPGHPLNQFSLDEYKSNLRIAVTISGSWSWGWRFSISGQSQSANDVYVLDSNLKILGAAKNMGLTERIYSVRFVEDKGYVVTFRETDPFYVLDLSDPKDPQIKGELKIPGFSSYLHPLAKDKILGIGRENWQVKISLFDVSSPQNPVEKAKYLLEEGWSEILNTHHAFLQDSKHQIFFLPGGQGAYIFSYKDDKLEMIKAISGLSQARRAIYLNDYLYVISDARITVINEIDWQKIREFDLETSKPVVTMTPPPIITIPPLPLPQF